MPTPDTPSFMRGSLVHNALYHLIRNKDIGEKWCDEADEELRRICREDGMWKIFSNWVYWAVRKFGKVAADPESRKKIHVDPNEWHLNPAKNDRGKFIMIIEINFA